MALIISMAANLVPQQSLGLQSFDVHGLLQDLFGSSEGESIDITLSSESSACAMFLHVDGVDGESTDTNHKDWIEILSYSMGMSDPMIGATGTTRRRGAVVMEDIVLVKEVDKSSPKLMDKCVKGAVIPSVTIEVCRNNGGDQIIFYRYRLENVMVTSFWSSGSTEEGVPVETVTLNYEEITVTYTETDDKGLSKGNVEFNWKVEEGETS